MSTVKLKLEFCFYEDFKSISLILHLDAQNCSNERHQNVSFETWRCLTNQIMLWPKHALFGYHRPSLSLSLPLTIVFTLFLSLSFFFFSFPLFFFFFISLTLSISIYLSLSLCSCVLLAFTHLLKLVFCMFRNYL